MDLTSYEFRDFMQMNGIKHIRSSAYHPSTNGGAERFVQTVKKGLKALKIEKGDAELKLRNYLLGYRSTPSTTTGFTPSELFLGRRIRTRLDLLKPSLKQRMLNYETKMAYCQNKRQEPRQFQPGEKVLLKNHIHGKPKWTPGIVMEQLSDRTYIIDIGQRRVKRHVDDIVQNHASIPISSKENDLLWDVRIPTNESNHADNNREPIIEMVTKRYPSRQRNPVTRYGIDSE